MNAVKDILKRINQVPPLSDTATSMLDVLGDPEHTVRDVLRVVENDASLATAVLKTVNSAAFGLRQEISTLERGVSYLGDKMVAGIALSMSTGTMFTRPLGGYAAGEGDLWRHSVCTAVACREVAAATGGRVSADVAYAAGLLHDIGKAIISEYLADEALRIIEAIDSGEHHGYLEAERAILGTDHAEVGGALAKQWNLPPRLVTAIRRHHEPAKAKGPWQALTYVVHLGDILAMMGGTGTGQDTLLYPLDKRYEEFVDMDERRLENVVLRVTAEYERQAPLLDQ